MTNTPKGRQRSKLMVGGEPLSTEKHREVSLGSKNLSHQISPKNDDIHDLGSTLSALADVLGSNKKISQEIGQLSWQVASLREELQNLTQTLAERAPHRRQPKRLEDKPQKFAPLLSVSRLQGILRWYGSLPMPVWLRKSIRKSISFAFPRSRKRLLEAVDADPQSKPSSQNQELFPSEGPVWLADINDHSQYRRGLLRVQRALTQHAAKYQPITHAIILPFFAQGGAEQTAWNFATAVHKVIGSGVVIIAADRKLPNNMMLEAPEGSLLIDLESTFGEADYRDREALLLAVLRLCQADTMHIINSEVAWRLLIKAPASLKQIGKVFGSIFAFQYDWETGQRLGYAETFLRDALPHLDGLLSDNQRFLNDAISTFNLEREKGRLATIYNPIRFGKEESDTVSKVLWKRYASIGKQDRLQILWAGRLDQEKRPELLIGAARLCPDMDFHVYGTKIVDDSDGVDINSLPNIFYHGPFTNPTAVVRDRELHAFMFTSRWEGMPNVVLEFGALGLPVVAAHVGGLVELIDDETGYPLPERAIAEDYADAFDDIATNPKEALARAAALKDRINSRHTFDRFAQRLSEVPDYLPKDRSSFEPRGQTNAA